MGLLRKVRVLVGALVHKPFAPQPARIDLGADEGPGPDQQSRPEDAGLEAARPPGEDTERVADLIAQQRRDQAGQG